MEASRSTISSELLPPRLAPLGYIKLGGKRPENTQSAKGNSFQPPVKFDHFKIRTRDRGQDGNLLPDVAVHEVIGPEPKELLVRLPFDHRAENFYAKMTQYSGQTEVRECNGETCIIKSTHAEEACSRRMGQACTCKPYGRLAVILEACPTFGGLYVFRTTSWESVNSIQTALGIFQEQFGSLRGLPLKMVCYPAEVRYKQGNDTKTGTAYKVALLLRASFEEAQHAAIEFHRTNRIAKREILMLASGTGTALEELDRADASEIGQEFFPEGHQPHAASAQATSKLAQINKAILAPQSTVAAPEPSEAPASTAAELVAEVRRLLNICKSTMTSSGVERIEAAIANGVPEVLTVAADWLRGLEKQMAEERS